MDDHDEEKRREENLFVRSDKSEAEVIREDCAWQGENDGYSLKN